MKKDKLILIVILVLVGIGSMIYISLPKQPSQNLEEQTEDNGVGGSWGDPSLTDTTQQDPYEGIKGFDKKE